MGTLEAIANAIAQANKKRRSTERLKTAAPMDTESLKDADTPFQGEQG